jgi:hypothetical protein
MDDNKEKPTEKKRDWILDKRLFKAFETEEKYEYVRFIVGNHLLDYDETGNACGWGEGFDLFYEMNTEFEEDYPISRKKYDNNETLQGSIAAIGLDSEKLWHAIRFIRIMSESRFVDAKPEFPPLGPQVEQLVGLLREEGTKIRIELPDRKTVGLSRELHDYLRGLIEKDYCPRKGDLFFTGEKVSHCESVTLGTQKQMAYETNLYMEIFKEYSTDKDLPRRGKGPSRDKLLLASRLLYLTGLTTNQTYWQGKDAIKGVIGKCQNVSRE